MLLRVVSKGILSILQVRQLRLYAVKLLFWIHTAE